MTDLKPTDFKFIEVEFADIIRSIREVDSTGLPSNAFTKRKTYILINKYKLYITEFLKNGFIDKFFYDLYDEKDKTVLKFHSEKHDRDSRYQTITEPFHIHQNEQNQLTNVHRFPNFNYRTLTDIMEFLRIMIIYMEKRK